jgi:phosphatidylglycerol---prolipoprotein diacylglyceryl transferase
MRPILFRVGSIPVYSYAAMLYVGTVLGIGAQAYAASRMGLDPAPFVIATAVLLVPALVGARLLYVALHWRTFRNEPRRILRAAKGGAAMYGGLVLALPVSVPLLAFMRIPFELFWDLASFAILIGMVVTRVGCFLNGCCAGRPSESWLAVNLPDARGLWQRRIPAQLLEAAWGAAILAGAVVLWLQPNYAGGLFLYTAAAYGAGRIVLELVRERRDDGFETRTNQALYGAMVGVAIVSFVLTRG